MYFDLTPDYPHNERATLQNSVSSPPMLSISISPVGSHDDLTLGTPINISSDSPICEKLDSIANTSPLRFNGVPQSKV